jgi:exopolyphosphatase/guanosine-5'-triphosphate,3'-diphosphate pyrophosphatase
VSDQDPLPGPGARYDAPSAPAVVPRWEWRAFRADIAELPVALTSAPPQDSDELYLVAAEGQDTVKVRARLMDVKRLEEVDDDGLERWRPIIKATFPLAAAELQAVWAALGLAAPALMRATYTLEQLIGELVDPSPEVRAIVVRKRRRQCTIGDCTLELTEVRTDREITETLAVESEHPDSVAAVVRDLGHRTLPNVSYVRWLKQVAGFEGPRYAAIDIGTNSVKLFVGEWGQDGRWRTVEDRAEITRLGEGLADTGRLQPVPAERTLNAAVALAGEARRAGAIDILAVGTAGLRRARNRGEFVDAMLARCGVPVEVISGEEEGRLSYLAVISTLNDNPGSICVFETGGGSSQFTFGHGNTVDERFSLDVGAARFTERFRLVGVVSAAVLGSVADAIAAELERLDGRGMPDTLIGIGGALTNLAAVKHRMETYDPDVVRGTILTREEVDRQIELYRTLNADERRRIIGLQPKRAEVILAGACIVRAVLEKLECESLIVSDRGLRHGLLIDRYG